MDNKDLEQSPPFEQEIKNESRKVTAKIAMGVSLALALPTLLVINWLGSFFSSSNSPLQFIVTEWNNGGWLELIIFFFPVLTYAYLLSLVIRLYRQKEFLFVIVLGSVLAAGSFGIILFFLLLWFLWIF